MHLINKVILNLGIEEPCETDCNSEEESHMPWIRLINRF